LAHGRPLGTQPSASAQAFSGAGVITRMTWRFLFHCRYHQDRASERTSNRSIVPRTWPQGSAMKIRGTKIGDSGIQLVQWWPVGSSIRVSPRPAARYYWPDRRRRPYGARGNVMIKCQCSSASLGLLISARFATPSTRRPVFYERRGRISLALERYRRRVYVAALPANGRELARFQAQRGIVASRPRKANSRARQVRS
jgi:hypothetical protein